MPKLSEILGEHFNQIPEELQTKYKDVDLVDSKQYITKDKFDALDEQLKNANTTITDLKKSNKDNETLQTKVGDYETKVKDYEKKIQDMQFNYALEGALKGANVRNTKAVKALLNLENIKLDGETLIGISEQIEELRKSDSYLFLEEQVQPKFSGVNPVDSSANKTPAKDTSKMSYTELCNYLEENPNAQI
ncbi:phage scaffolding protein [Clostridium botulinum]|uniref:phage scaffolding protein n=2 Tax=Clostridium botulinum TaxID=1491 RepID=UPI00016B9BDB|nr:phage scaffolding protein [Clostridium botulinum]APC82404.1 phage minor structural GP20 family protein [Clostridium botulinum]AXG97343.1 scaffolding protein [Clostridium botulinum]EDT81552.1 scaffold protein [Clostridium botulinum NCTC 2916]MBY6773172.1 phage scaffolding protein [Clostridium botulinum]MBY6776789.1 phage scaffolding protein [Clostridium botulinum]